MDAAERLTLANEVFTRCFEQRDNFRDDNFGCDLCYLLGAIIDPAGNGRSQGWVDWVDLEATREFFREHFPADHPVWTFIVTEDETVCDCTRSNGPHAACTCEGSAQ
jgi:hypothetical protein